jgi:hypothetical protein
MHQVALFHFSNSNSILFSFKEIPSIFLLSEEFNAKEDEIQRSLV